MKVESSFTCVNMRGKWIRSLFSYHEIAKLSYGAEDYSKVLLMLCLTCNILIQIIVNRTSQKASCK